MKLVWSRRAIDHLAAIRDFIAQESPDHAAEVAGRIVEGVELLRRFPEAGRPGRTPGTRELVIPGTRYLIPYRLRGEALDILAVFHGRQRWPRKL